MPTSSALGARPWLDPEPLPLEDLPRVRIHPRLRAEDAGAAVFEAGDPRSYPGIVPPVDCSLRRGHVPMHFETLSPGRDGATLFAITDALLDATSCRLRVIARTETQPRPIAGGLGFAFVSLRASPGSAAPDRVHVVVPHSGGLTTSGNEVDVVVSWGLVRVSFPLRRGVASSMATVVHRYTLADWVQTTTGGESAASAALHRFAGMTDMTVFVEVGQGVRDRSPIAFAFVRRQIF